jgi:hypothetical protein
MNLRRSVLPSDPPNNHSMTHKKIRLYRDNRDSLGPVGLLYYRIESCTTRTALS